MSYRHYLHRRGYSPESVKNYVSSAERYKKWIKENGRVEVEQMIQKDILPYIQHLKAEKRALSTINNVVIYLRSYYDYLQREEIVTNNPLRNLQLKGGKRAITENPLTPQELGELYQTYTKPRQYREPLHETTHKRNQLIVSLMIYQGLHSGELGKLQKGDINVMEGKIKIAGSRRSNSRTLALGPHQIIPLHGYLQLMCQDQQSLFTVRMYDVVKQLIKELKEINPSIRNASHIRSSVIINWLKHYDKREVQYRIGHKYISSVEHYERQELSELESLLEQHHPLK